MTAIEVPSSLYAPTSEERLSALRAIANQSPQVTGKGTNTHVHTNYSFSVFQSPVEAAWIARASGVEIFGINDHYTVDGQAEFAEACDILGIPATLSIESVALDREFEAAGLLMNDPGNPGRTYLSGKGVTDRENPAAAQMLADLRHHQAVRNQAMLVKIQELFKEKLQADGPQWSDIEAMTPKGNSTERHLARAVAERLKQLAEEQNSTLNQLHQQLCDSDAEDDWAALQNGLRSRLLKAGKPCFVEEAPEAYPALADLRQLFLHLGSIPTYPVLGNPLTPGEETIEGLADRLAERGIFAIELIPARNTDDRVAEVLEVCAKRGWPVFDGTEHNTATMDPLLTQWGTDPRFRQQFHDGACVLLGHQALVAAGELGYVDREGQLTADGYARCLAAGKDIATAAV